MTSSATAPPAIRAKTVAVAIPNIVRITCRLLCTGENRFCRRNAVRAAACYSAFLIAMALIGCLPASMSSASTVILSPSFNSSSLTPTVLFGER